MAFFGLFGGKKKGYSSPWLQLTVVYATAREGLEPEHKFAIRGKVLAAKPIRFEISESHTYSVFFPGSEAGLQAGNSFAESLREYAREKSLSSFGVGVAQGECLAQMSGTGRLADKPAGAAVAQAKQLATEEADANVRPSNASRQD